MRTQHVCVSSPEASCSSHSGFNQLNAARQNNSACLPELHSPLYGHQFPSLIAPAQEHAAIRAISQLLQCGVAVHCPQGALPLLHLAASTVPHIPTVGYCKKSNSPHISYLKVLSLALSCCDCYSEA